MRFENATFGDCLAYTEDWDAIDELLDSVPEASETFDDYQKELGAYGLGKLADHRRVRKFFVPPTATLPVRFRKGEK